MTPVQLSLIDLCDTAPYQPHSATSRAAAVAIAPKLGALQTRVLRFIANRGEHGATDEEICDGLELNPSTGRPRRVELAAKNLIKKAEKPRPTKSGRDAAVWRVIDAAHDHQ